MPRPLRAEALDLINGMDFAMPILSPDSLSLHALCAPATSSVIQLRIPPRSGASRSGGIEGLFFQMPRAWQVKRIRELAQSQSPEAIAFRTHKSLAEVTAILEGRQP